jgi:hypothetical protein
MQPVNRPRDVCIRTVLVLDSRRKDEELICPHFERLMVNDIPTFAFGAIDEYELMTAFLSDPRVIRCIGIEPDIGHIQIPA